MSLDTQDKDAPPIAWSWLKTISRDLYELDETPLLGQAPAFNWEKLANECAKALSLEGLKITPGELVWKEKDAILSGIAAPTVCTQIAATGIEGTATLWMCREDVEHIMAKVLQISQVVSELQAEDVVTNFHRFLSIEAVCLLNQIGYDPRISFKITGFSSEPTKAALCQDITIQLGNEQMLCRLVITNEFRSSWRELFLKPPAGTTQKAALDNVETTIRLEAGRTTLLLDDLLKIRAGDLVLLDRVFYDEAVEKSHVLLTLEGTPLFKAGLKSGSLTILERPLQNEVYTSMVEQVNPPTSPSNFEPTNQAGTTEHEEDNPFPDEEEEDEDEGLELVEAASTKTLEETLHPAAAPKAKSVSVAPRPTPTSDKLTANDIPIELIVEVAALTLSVQKVLELAPGNVLDLGITPESGVNLVVNNRVVGKGELLKIGETIGVRILQIGV